MDRKKLYESFWHPKKPPKSLNKSLLDFEVLKTLTSQKTTNVKGQSFRGFTDVFAEVRLFYYLRENKHFEYIQRAVSDLAPRQGEVRRDLISKSRKYADFTLILKGETSRVLSESIKKLKGSGLNQNFLTDWENCTTSNITDHINHVEGLAVKEITGNNAVQFGIYNQQNPSDILLSKIKRSDQSLKTISQMTGVPITMIYRHTQNKAPIDRHYAIAYAKYFGMDPSEILFNDISIPLEGTVSFEGEMSGEVKRKIGTYEFVKCPRDIYRPDIQCVKVESKNSLYNNCNLFYYQSKPGDISNNQLCIFIFGRIGTGNRNKNKVIGRFSLDKFGKRSIKNPDPEIYSKAFDRALDKRKYGEEIEISDMISDNQNLYCTLKGKDVSDLNKDWPLAILPIVAIVNPTLCTKDEHRTSLIKEEETWYKRRILEDGSDLTETDYRDLRSNDIKELREKIYESLVENSLTGKEQNFTVKKELVGEVDEAFDLSIAKLKKKLEKISKDVQNLGYPDFKLPDPEQELKKLENEEKDKFNTHKKRSPHLTANMKFVEANKKKDKPVDWLIDPELPIDIKNFIELDPKAAKNFFNHGIEGYENFNIYVGEAKGENRAEVAAKIALEHDKGEKLSSASEICVVITGNNSITLGEVDKAVDDIRKKVKPDTDLVFAAIFDDNMEEKIRVSILPAFEEKLKDHVLIQNAINNFYYYRSIGARKDALRMALSSPALDNEHRDKVVKKIAEKTPEVLSYNKAEIFPLRRTG